MQEKSKIKEQLRADAEKTFSERERERDDFWNMDMVLPKKPPQSSGQMRDTETVEVTFGGENEENLSAFAPVKQEQLRIPPIPNITQRRDTASARRIVEERFAESFSGKAHGGQGLSSHRLMTGTELAEKQSADAAAPDTGTEDAAVPYEEAAAMPPASGNGSGWHTPGDVKPQMSVPVCSYTPENSLLRTVGVFRWPSRYNYYERFTSDANRYFARTAEECPFVNFFAYMPQYSAMSQDQLRWYLYWRDNVRRGTYLTTDYSYIFLYIYEIINLPEKIPPEEGLEQLCKLWLAYREKFPRLDRYLGEWVCDYCLVYELPAPIDTLAPILPALIDKLSFKEFYIRYDRGAECPFTPSLCDVLSNYNWRQSKYVTPETRPLFEKHFYPSVLGALRAVWGSSEPGEFAASVGLSEVGQTRNAFSGALCTYNAKRRIDIRYLSLSRSYQLRFFLTDLYKMAENGIRAHLGIKSRLSATGVPEPMKSFLRAYFEEHLPSQASVNRAKSEEARLAAKKAREEERLRAQQAEEDAYSRYYEPQTSSLSPDAALALERQSWENTQLLVPEEDAPNASALSEEDGAAEQIPGALSTDDVSSDETAAGTAPSAEAVPSAEASPAEPAPDDTLTGLEIPEGDDPYVNFVFHLNQIYYDALKHIICGEEKEYAALCSSVMMLPDAMADAINEAAVTYTDDTALEPDGSFWKLSDYYANEITAAVILREDS